MNIYFNQKEANDSLISIDEAKSNFSISWNYLTDKYYTLLIYDIDIGDCDPTFMAINIKENNVNDSDKIIEYKVPTTRTKVAHTFVVDVYIQGERIDNLKFIEDMNLKTRYCSKAEDLILYAKLTLIYRTTFIVM